MSTSYPHHTQGDDRDRLEIAIRSYVAKRPSMKGKPRKSAPPPPNDPSEWVLVFDTETTADHRQRLRFGAYQIRHDDELRERGLFFDPETMSADEIILLRARPERVERLGHS